MGRKITSKKNKTSKTSERVQKVCVAKNAARERTRVKELRDGFLQLQSLIPNIPPDTKLSKLDVLILATIYIKHLSKILDTPETEAKTPPVTSPTVSSTVSDTNTSPSSSRNEFHPVKKWPMRTRLYASKLTEALTPSSLVTNDPETTCSAGVKSVVASSLSSMTSLAETEASSATDVSQEISCQDQGDCTQDECHVIELPLNCLDWDSDLLCTTGYYGSDFFPTQLLTSSEQKGCHQDIQ